MCDAMEQLLPVEPHTPAGWEGRGPAGEGGGCAGEGEGLAGAGEAAGVPGAAHLPLTQL